MAAKLVSYRNGVQELMKRVNNSDVNENEKQKISLPPISKPANKIPDRSQQNPFTMPAGNAWIDLGKAEKQKEIDNRKAERKKKVHQKHTFSSRTAYSTLPAIRNMCKNIDAELKLPKQNYKQQNLDYTMTSTRTCRVRPVEREFTHDFIQKKREIFLMEYALQTRRHEIEKHKSRAMKEDLNVVRLMQKLHEDAVLFDDFLKATDDAAVEAMKFAEKETKLKLEKVAAYRKCLSRVTAIKSEISKKDEILSDFLSYKIFLTQVHENLHKRDSLPTDPEKWMEKREQERKNILQRRAKKLKEKQEKKGKSDRKKINRSLKKLDDRMLGKVDSKQSFSKVMYPEEWEEDEEEECDTEEHGSIKNIKEKRMGILVKNKKAKQAARERQIRADEQPAWIPFEKPKQLLDILHNFEEKNLNLIYKYQHSEEELEDIRMIANNTLKRLDAETKKLKSHVKAVKLSIMKHEERANELSFMHKILSEGSRERDSKQALQELTNRVEKVYRSVIGPSYVNMDGLMMLTSLETRMDDLLDEVEALPVHAVAEVQRARDKERRRHLREEIMAIQKLKQEERARKAVERANAVNFKNAGKKLVFRSTPLKVKEKEMMAKKIALCSSSVESFDFFSHE